MSASRRRFTQEIKDELCREVISTSKSIRDVAIAYDVGPEALRNWLIKCREANAKTAPVSPVLWRAFVLDRPVVSARADVTGLGYIELHPNSHTVGESVRGFGWAPYREHRTMPESTVEPARPARPTRMDFI